MNLQDSIMQQNIIKYSQNKTINNNKLLKNQVIKFIIQI
jgi:hypothetical protein